jgi:N-acetylglucosaminyldiphosphoundecaprenol N-acetyl-beta-D-mannosaminyltransferase
MPTHGYTLNAALAAIEQDIRQGRGGYVCLANVHMCMEAFDDANFSAIMQNARYVLADGRPIFWGQKLLGATEVEQIRGFDLVVALCEKAASNGFNIGLYGGSDQQLLAKLQQQLCQRFPTLNIVYSYAPPFFTGELPIDEQALQVIAQQQVQILLVGLGCPKQERWMALHHQQIIAQQAAKQSLGASPMMFGVGAAFDFLSGSKNHAPTWMQKAGLEWLHRLAFEPQRLGWRYLKHNPRFILHFGWQWIRCKIKPSAVVR